MKEHHIEVEQMNCFSLINDFRGTRLETNKIIRVMATLLFINYDPILLEVQFHVMY